MRSQTRELVFVSENVTDYEQLIADLQQTDSNRIFEVVVLDSDQDGIEQVSEILSARHDLAAVHFITHGTDGQINLGGTWLDSETLQQNSDAVAAWGNALTESGDILFYGCNIAAESDGHSLLKRIASLTGADVAASEDLTGSADRGADWVLEYETGVIETQVAPSEYGQKSWEGLLAEPTLTWNTFLGGSGNDTLGNLGNNIAVDGSGNVYVTGNSSATWGTPVQAFGGGTRDAFVAKFDSSGNLIWNTFLGGTGNESGHGICVDGSGNVYVGGYGSATWGTPLQAFGGGANDAFVAKLASDGSLTWNSFLGGTGDDRGYSLALDGSGNVYVSGNSGATWGTPVEAFSGGTSEAFAAKLGNDGSLTWNSFLGSSGATDTAYAVTVDGNGNVYVSGNSGATWGTPVQAHGGGTDGFAAKLSDSGSLTWNTFLGTAGTDAANGVVVDASGDVYICGLSSATWGSPVRAFSGGANDAFTVRLSNSGTLTWNTFLGGASGDWGGGIAIDASGNVYVGGYSSATWGTPSLPYTASTDVFAAAVDTNGNLVWNAFLGGSGSDMFSPIAVSGGNVYVAGQSGATWGTPVQAFGGGTNDVFAAKIAVPPTNTAPVLDNSGFLTLTTITEDDIGNSGNLISEIIASDGGDRITDPDAGAVEGIAILALTSGNGTWEYNIGSGWTAVGAVSDTSSLLLRETDSLRFVPDGLNADTAFVTFAAWDQTSGTAGTKVDASSYGGTTAFSEAVETASITVTAVNDAPTVTTTGSALAYTENDPATVIDAGLTVSDPDNANLDSVIVRITGNFTSGQDVLAFTNQLGITGSWNAGTGILTLSGLTTVANYQAALRTVTYQNTSDNPNTAARTISFFANDGIDSGTAATRNINITADNDPPVITLPAGELNYTEGDGPVVIDATATASDSDSADFDTAAR